MIYLNSYSSPIGKMTMASDGLRLIGLWFDGQKYDRYFIRKEKTETRSLPVFDECARWLDLYFDGKEPGFLPGLAFSGTDFQKEIQGILFSIPYRKTISYGEIAKVYAIRHKIKHMSSQAIGQAVGHNPISILIPCHRVLSSDRKITGYAGGVDRKRYLLNLERISFDED